MSDPTGEELVAPTQRLVFDTALTEDDIPAFLRRKSVEEPECEEAAAEIHEPEIRQQPFVAPAEPERSEAVVEEVAVLVEARDETLDEEPGVHDDTGHGSGQSAALDELSVDDLKRQQEEIQRKIKEKQEAEKAAVIDQIKDVASQFHITIEELVDAFGGVKIKRKGVKAEQKYRDPKSGATWSGRGKEPTWIRGKKRDNFLIK